MLNSGLWPAVVLLDRVGGGIVCSLGELLWHVRTLANWDAVVHPLLRVLGYLFLQVPRACVVGGLNPLSFLSSYLFLKKFLKAQSVVPLDVLVPSPQLSPKFVIQTGVLVVALEESSDGDYAPWNEITLRAL